MATTEEIQSWLNSNPNATDEDIAAAMKTHGVSTKQLETALKGMGSKIGLPEIEKRFSAASTKNLAKDAKAWLAANPNATDQDIVAAMDKGGYTPEQISKALNVPLDQMQQLYSAAKSGAGTVTQGTQTGYQGKKIDPSQSTLSPNFSDYVYRMLGKFEQLSNMPYQPFTGDRYADTQALLDKTFKGYEGFKPSEYFDQAAELSKKISEGLEGLKYTPKSFTDEGVSSKYMSPYMQDVLDIEKREAQRQADIAATRQQAEATARGALGGSRDAIMRAERERNLSQLMSDIQTKGLQEAYKAAQGQFNTEQTAGLDAARLGMTGLANQIQNAQLLGNIGQSMGNQQLTGLQGMLTAGTKQQDLAQNPYDFGFQQWQESMMFPYMQARFMREGLQGLPLNANPYSPPGSALGAAVQGGLAGLTLSSLLNQGAKNP